MSNKYYPAHAKLRQLVPSGRRLRIDFFLSQSCVRVESLSEFFEFLADRFNFCVRAASGLRHVSGKVRGPSFCCVTSDYSLSHCCVRPLGFIVESEFHHSCVNLDYSLSHCCVRQFFENLYVLYLRHASRALFRASSSHV